MKSVVLLMWLTMPNTGEVIYSPTSFYNDIPACEAKADNLTGTWKGKLPLVHKCLVVTPEVAIDDSGCKKGE